MDDRYPPQYRLFVEKFNAGEYYECHDLLEEVWMENKSDKFLQGLLQMAVGLYHFECGNVKGARWMLQNARKYLSRYVPTHWGMDVEQVMAAVDRCLAALPGADAIPCEEVSRIAFPWFRLYIEEPENGETNDDGGV